MLHDKAVKILKVDAKKRLNLSRESHLHPFWCFKITIKNPFRKGLDQKKNKEA